MTLSEARVEETQSALAERKSFVPVAPRNVLFATDFSPTSEAALPYATAICRRFGSTLHAAHVLSDANLLVMTGGVDYVSMGTIYDSAHQDASERLEHMALRFEGIPHHNYVRHGLIWNNLAEIIAESDVDLIVVGTHGRTGLGKLLLGSVAEDILRHAPCPVLSVGPKISGRAKLPAFLTPGRDLAPPELDLRQIVFATNFTHNAELVAQAAVSLAESFRARLTLVHVFEDYTHLGSQPDLVEKGVRHLQELLPKNAALQYTPETVLEFGSAGERILRIASQREADLLVLGARTAAHAGSTHLPWTTAHQVIAQAHCPVLTIRE
ncbi:MAG: universal stress protein [Candidatus Sulfotelmatobacter sp.]